MHQEFEPSGPTEERFVEQLAASLWRLRRVPVFEAALFDREAHFYDEDLIGPKLSINLAADPHALPASTGDQQRERFLIGRAIGILMSRHDVINKLSRHEAHLMRQVEKTLAQLRALRAERAVTAVKQDPNQPAPGYVELVDGWEGLLAPPGIGG